MALFKCLLAVIAVMAVTVSADEELTAAQTLATYNASAFVYVPSTTFTGQVSVGLSSFPVDVDEQCMRSEFAIVLQRSILKTCCFRADRGRQRYFPAHIHVLPRLDRHGHFTVSIYTGAMRS